MSNKTKAYFAVTVLVSLALAAGGFFNATGQERAIESMTHLGYPIYFPRIIGVWKLLAAVALLAPRFPRLKEWAYAGIFFNMTGAAISHIGAGDPVSTIFPSLGVLTLAMISWYLRPDDRKLA